MYCQVPDSDEQDMNKAVEAAKNAFPTWSKMTRQQRSDILMKVASLIEARLEGTDDYYDIGSSINKILNHLYCFKSLRRPSRKIKVNPSNWPVQSTSHVPSTTSATLPVRSCTKPFRKPTWTDWLSTTSNAFHWVLPV